MPATLADNRWLRLTTLCALYVAQGIPFGFVTITLAAYLSGRGLSVDAIGPVLAVVTLPWSFKWIWGPVIDRFGIRSMGRRRPWILLAQSLMTLTIGWMIAVSDLASDLKLLTGMILILNVFASIQDVSVDALAVDLLPEDERGRANGLMYGSSYFGTALGGAGLGWVLSVFGLRAALVTQASILLGIMCLPLLIREREGDSLFPTRYRPQLSNDLKTSQRPQGRILASLLRAFSLRSSILAAVLAVGTRIGTGVLTAVGVNYYIRELGWTQQEYSSIEGGSAVAAGLIGACLGGFLADYVGARRLAACATLLLGIGWIVFALSHDHWINKNVVTAMLIGKEFLAAVFTVALYTVFMSVSWPRVAATQFTAYMALMNLSTTIGSAIAGPTVATFGVQGVFITAGLLQCSLIALLPLIDVGQTRRVLGNE